LDQLKLAQCVVVYKLQSSKWLKQTETFRKWRTQLKEERTRAIIASRLDRLAFGNSGDAKPVGQEISELRIDYGPGYRIYLRTRGSTIIILLCGGNKSTQAKDIETAKRLSKEWSEDEEKS
jgi:putative addiction module killer protein